MSTKGPVSYYKVVPVANPAAGAEFTLAAPGGEFWRVLALRFVFATSAAVANRVVRLNVGDGTDIYASVRASAAQAAGATIAHSAVDGVGGNAVVSDTTNIDWPHGGLLLQPGHRITSSTALIDVADQYSAIIALVQSFPQGPDIEWLPTVDSQLFEMG